MLDVSTPELNKRWLSVGVVLLLAPRKKKAMLVCVCCAKWGRAITAHRSNIMHVGCCGDLHCFDVAGGGIRIFVSHVYTHTQACHTVFTLIIRHPIDLISGNLTLFWCGRKFFRPFRPYFSVDFG